MEGLFGRYRAILAPMAGVSDAPFRLLCREAGADIAFCEMVSAKGLSYANLRTQQLLDRADGEDAIGVQLFGHEPAVLAQQAAWVEHSLGDAVACIDINMGCPARKIVSKGDGCALMQEPSLAADIVRSVKAAVSRPVTAKFRRGWKIGVETAVDFAKRLEDAGADALTVHGRFGEQLYRGAAEWDAIARVKSAVSIPVAGNGDVRSGADACAMVARTGCDAVMIARAAEGNPWVFTQVQAALAGMPEPEPPSPVERIEMARRHARMLDAGGRHQLVRMRKHAMWYIAGLPGAAKARGLLSACSTLGEFEAVFDALIEKCAIEAVG